eukprot:scaffold9201_cov231-Alexandrium_tamarense.AAC.2
MNTRRRRIALCEGGQKTCLLPCVFSRRQTNTTTHHGATSAQQSITHHHTTHVSASVNQYQEPHHLATGCCWLIFALATLPLLYNIQHHAVQSTVLLPCCHHRPLVTWIHINISP